MPAKRYFEFSEGSSNKFWEVWRAGADVFTRFGKIGASGQTTIKKLASDADAKKLQDKLVGEKTGKGYVEGGSNGATKKAAKSNGKAAKAEAPVEDAPVDVPPGALRLEVASGSSNKFWQIQRDTKSITVTFGKIGTPGTVQKTKFKEEWDARHTFNKQLEEKKQKGYQLVLGGPRPKVPAVAASNPQLEQAILKDPSSDDGFMVYSDWLQQQGDVRGELATLQMRRAKSPKDKKLENAEAKLLWEYRAHFYGPLAVYLEQKPKRDTSIEARWRQGWMDSLTVSAVVIHTPEGEVPVPQVSNTSELIRLLPKVTSARFLRELVIACPVAESEFHFDDSIKELAKTLPALPALRRVTIGRFNSDDMELSWSHLGKADALWPAAKKLEYLKIRSGSMSLGKIDAPELRELWIETGGLDKKTVAAIAAAKWPKLETLNLWFGQDNYGCDCKVKDILPLLDPKRFPRLLHLGIANTTMGDQLAPHIAAAKILKQLETLDLSMSHLTVAGMRVYAEHKSAFAHFVSLDVSRCLLDKEGIKLAKTLAKSVDVSDQEDPTEHQPEEGEDAEEQDAWWRYSAVGE